MPLPTKNSFDDLFGYQITSEWAKDMCTGWNETCDKFNINGKTRKQLANIVTTINLVFTALIFGCLYLGRTKAPVFYVIGIVFLTIRQYLDMLDGSIARQCDMKSKFGNYYDHIADAIFALGLAIMFVVLTSSKWKWLSGIIGSAVFVSVIIDLVNCVKDTNVPINKHINDNLIVINLFIYLFIVTFIEASHGNIKQLLKR